MQKKDKFFTKILILIIIVICLDTGFNRAITIDFHPTNGDFQNYNVWRRLIYGQVPFKDFPVYLGTGHLILGSFFTKILGNTFMISLVVSNALTVAISVSIIILISYLILRNLNIALSNAVAVLVLTRENFPWFSQLIYSEFLVGLNFFTPGNSARIIRNGVVIFVAIGVLVTIIFVEKLYINRRIKNKTFLKRTLISIISGAAILYSNDVGISSYIAFSFIFFICQVKRYGIKDIIMVLKQTLYYIFVSVLTFLLIITIITRGSIKSWFDFTFSASQYQRWYFENSEFSKVYSIFEIGISPMAVATIIIIIIYIYKIFKDKQASQKDYIFWELIIYILLTGLISAYMYRIIAGGYSTELLSLSFFSLIVSYIFKYIYEFIIDEKKKINFKEIYIAFVIIFSISFLTPRIYNTLLKNKVYEKPGVYIDSLGGNLTTLSEDIFAILDKTKSNEIFSTYASAVETIKGDFQPTGIDYIIHALGDETREEYLQEFLSGNYKFVQTINRDFTDWELWIESSNWFFYKELYKRYTPTLTTSYSVIWEPVNNKINLLDNFIDLSVEKVSENQYKIICTADSDINAIVDVKISYESQFLKHFLHNGVFAKQVHVSDITRDRIYNSIRVNYFIPPSSDGYNIPITIVDGVGEIIISSFPRNETTLDINIIKLNEVMKNPFLDFKASNLTDTNWIKGVNRNNNVILFSNTNYNNSFLNKAISLKGDNNVANILDVEEKGDWIHVTVDGNKEAFSYPNIIEVIKE